MVRSIKRKSKPTAPQEPKTPERQNMIRNQTLPGYASRDELIQALQQLPKEASVRVSGGDHCSCCNGDCYEDCSVELAASWSDLQTDAEYAQTLKYHQQSLKNYQKSYAKYQKDLAAWETWYQENKEAMEAEDQRAKEAEVKYLEKAIQENQKQLDAALKNLAKKSKK